MNSKGERENVRADERKNCNLFRVIFSEILDVLKENNRL